MIRHTATPDGTPVLDVDEVVRLEQAIAESGTSLATLMRRAGTAVADAAARLAPDTHQPIAILAGSGNNGGDGWVAAEVLASRGYRAEVIALKAPREITAQPAADAAARACGVAGVNVLSIEDGQACQALLAQVSVIIDALFGTGFSGRTVRGTYADVIEQANLARERGARIIAADVPSGLSAQTGEAADHTISADATVTMMALKPGLLTPAGRRLCGAIEVARIADLAPFLLQDDARQAHR